MIKAESTVVNETKYVAFFCILLSVIMQGVFLLLKKWDYTVLFGNILILVASVLNFYFMGLTVQEAITKEESEAKKLMKSSQGLRSFGMFIFILLGVVLDCFNIVAVILTVFFPRIAVAFRPIFNKKEVVNK